MAIVIQPPFALAKIHWAGRSPPVAGMGGTANHSSYTRPCKQAKVKPMAWKNISHNEPKLAQKHQHFRQENNTEDSRKKQSFPTVNVNYY